MSKVVSLLQLREILHKLPDSKVVVSTCGCFEIFHIGHLECLEKAKENGDILIVGINSDDYIMKIKGRCPVFNEYDRSKIISSLQCVDYVFVFREETFDYSLQQLQPDLFIKGCDRINVVEEKTALEYGIKIINVGNLKRSSATELRTYFVED